MRKTSMFRFLILLILLTLFITSCANDQENVRLTTDNSSHEESNGEPEIETRKFHAAAMHYPPLEIVENGELTGPGIEVVREVFKRMGYTDETFKISPYPWQRLLEMAKLGELDMVIDVSDTPERNEFLDLSTEPYAEYYVHFFVRKDSEINFDGDLSEMTNYTIGLVQGYSYFENICFALENDIITVDEAMTSSDNFDKLIYGRLDIIAEEKYNASTILNEKGYADEVKMLDIPIEIGQTYVGFPKVLHHDDIRDEFDRMIKEVRDDGTEEKIFKKYFDK